MWRAITSALVALAFVFVPVRQAWGEGSIVIVEDSQKNNWPNDVLFTLKAQAAGEIKSVRIEYFFGRGVVTAKGSPKFTPGKDISAEFTLKTGGNDYIPPGSEMTYSYTLEDAAGNTLKTEPKKWVYLDTRFKWQTLTDGQVTVYHHDSREANVRAILKAGVDTIVSVGQKAGVQLKSPLTVVAYNSVRELDAAIAFSSQASRDTVAGQAHAAFNVVLVASDAGEAVRNTMHEATHIITDEATRGALSEVPAWLNEGLSTYFQDNQGSEWNDLLRNAIRQDRLLTLKYLNGRPGKLEENALLYAEGGSAVKYAIETYGPQKMAELLAAYKSGETTEKAFQKAYGLSLEAFENAWRKSIGAKPIEGSGAGGAQPTPPGGRPNPVPTLPPLTGNPPSGSGQPTPAGAPPAGVAGTPAPTPPAGQSEQPSRLPGMLPIVAALGAVALVALAGVIGLALFLRRDRF